jgi:hypothetical protein
MAATFLTTSETTGTSFWSGVDGDSVSVATGVVLTDTANDGTSNTNGFVDIQGSATVLINGSASSFGDTIVLSNDLTGAGSGTALVQIGAAGSVTSLSGYAINIDQFHGNGTETENIANAGSLEGGNGGILSRAPGMITNNGTIYGGSFGVGNDDAVSTDKATLFNHGTITGGMYGVADLSGHSAFIYNTGAIDGGAGGFAVYSDAATKESLTNYATGTLSGGVDLKGTATVVNAGAIGGGTTLAGVAKLTNSGRMDHVSFTDAAAGSSFTNTGLLTGGLNAAGASFAAGNSGTIDGSVVLSHGGGHITNKGLIDGGITFAGIGNVYNGTAGSVTGTIHGAGADGVYYGGNDGETFDMTASGAKLVVGGSGGDTFIFTAAGLTHATTVEGGGGTGVDTLKFSTAGTITASELFHVSGIEQIDLANGTNSIALTDALVASANGASLTVSCGSGGDTINASGITKAVNQLTIEAGQGRDIIVAGGGTDTFVFTNASQSTGPAYDRIAGVDWGLDRFDLNGAAVTAIDLVVTAGSLSTATFNTDLAAVLGPAHLKADSAVLFTASAGTLAGHTFLVEDTNGVAGYQAGHDLVFDVTGAKGKLSTTNFV